MILAAPGQHHALRREPDASDGPLGEPGAGLSLEAGEMVADRWGAWSGPISCSPRCEHDPEPHQFQMIVCPAVVGGGNRFFPDGVRLDLELAEERRFRNGVVFLRDAVGG